MEEDHSYHLFNRALHSKITLTKTFIYRLSLQEKKNMKVIGSCPSMDYNFKNSC